MGSIVWLTKSTEALNCRKLQVTTYASSRLVIHKRLPKILHIVHNSAIFRYLQTPKNLKKNESKILKFLADFWKNHRIVSRLLIQIVSKKKTLSKA